MSLSLVWFRKDLRLHDNPAWSAALKARNPILPVYILEDAVEDSFGLGGASKWWLHHALKDLDSALRQIGGNLIVFKGDPNEILAETIQQKAVKRVFWSCRYEPVNLRLDSAIKKQLENNNIQVLTFNGSLLFDPCEVSTKQGNAYKVYTAFRRATELKEAPKPFDSDNSFFKMASSGGLGLEIDNLGLLPKLDWADQFGEFWTPSRRGGLARLNQFLGGPLFDYDEKRDFPAINGTSRLSPYLHWGQIGVREVANKIRPILKNKSAKSFYDELIWREFAYHVLYHFPDTPNKPLQDKYQNFPWEEDNQYLKAWQKGETGYPLIDAGMRQLWKHGWMHNRVRMVVGSLLVKHLLQPWQDGAAWFWDCLVDADLASNTLGWQWVGGCGADAAPYFRIFNPITQSETFDPDGDYIRTYVPELDKLCNQYIHKPWEAPESVLKKAGVKLDVNYPFPIISHKEGRERALAALEKIKVKEHK